MCELCKQDSAVCHYEFLSISSAFDFQNLCFFFISGHVP